MIDAGKLAMIVHTRWHGELIHATNAVNSERPKNGSEGYHQTIEQSDIDVCLNCTKRKCIGAEACFNREKQRKKL